MDSIIHQQVQTAVQHELQNHLLTFEDKFNNKLNQAFITMDSNNEARITALLKEQQESKQEYRNNSNTTTTQFEQIMAMFAKQNHATTIQAQGRTINNGTQVDENSRSTHNRTLTTRSTRNSVQNLQGSQQSYFDSGAIKSCLNKLKAVLKYEISTILTVSQRNFGQS
jgi:hypothetical protein